MTIKHQITSLKHPLIKHLVKLRLDHKYRYENNSILIEGVKPVQEVATYIKKLIRLDSHSSNLAIPEEWIVTEAIMKKISGMTSPEGIVAEVQMPSFSSLKGLKLILGLDGINDPGNMGTLLRTALALGWEGAYILPNSCDPYNEKTIRAARGAHFRLPLGMGSCEQLKKIAQENHLEPLVADLKGQIPEQINKQKGRLLVLGNEAHGASKDIQFFCSKVTIPMPGEMESLNVAIAGSILMYLLKI
jgi:TrmH family RNA methyltransferase